MRRIRLFSYIRKTESYSEFSKKLQTEYKTHKLPEKKKSFHSLVYREDAVEEREFFTESDDFDPETFNLREYLWEAVYLRGKITLFKVAYCWLFWLTLVFIGTSSFVVVKKVFMKASPLGYFDMLSPAFLDMNLIRYNRRLKFKTLELYD